MRTNKIIIPRTGARAKFKLVEEGMPLLDANQILVKAEVCGVAFADVLMREGLYPDVERRNLTPGYDVVGRVIDKGSNVNRIAVGDRVASLTQTGAYADHVVVEEDLSVICPEHLPAQQLVALILNYTTAYQMLTRIARVIEGETILVHGAAGGVGSALVELGLQMGLTVYGTLSKRKWHALPEIINHHALFHKLDYQAQPFEQALTEHEPEGVDFVFDAIGGGHLKRSYQALRSGGVVVSYGFSTAMTQGNRNWVAAIKGLLKSLISPVTLIQDNKTIAGYGIWNYALAHPVWLREDLSQLIQWLDEGRLHPMIAKSYPLAQAECAQDKVSRSDFAGKVVLEMVASG